jgi:hypothetical protein
MGEGWNRKLEYDDRNENKGGRIYHFLDFQLTLLS